MMKDPNPTLLNSKPANPRSGATYFATVSPFSTTCTSKSSTSAASPFAFSSHKSSEVADGFTCNTKTASTYCAQGPPIISIPCLREALYSLDMKMAMLMNQRDELEFHLEQAVRLQSPVQRLPSELLSSIFVAAVLGIDDSDSVMVSTLMLVCRYWSDVALNTPVLWSTISVSTHDSLVKARRKLTRSKSVPLDITINFSPRVEHSSGVTENVLHAMDLIRPALWRTKSFRLSVPSRSQAYAALSRCQEDAPLLENLSIRIFHSIQEDHYITPPLSLFNCHTPRLRSCSFTSFNFGWDVKFVSRLRILKLGGYYNGFSPSVDTLIDILRECPELEEFALRNMSDVELDVCSVSEEEVDPPKVLRLRRLIKASFYYAGVARTRMLLGQISFPALEALEFCYLDNLTPILHHLRTQSLTSLPLRALRIESSFFDELKFVKLLCRLPSLVTLELVDVEDASSNLLKGLATPPAAQPWICPRLVSLDLDGCTTLDWDSLRTFVESRLPANTHVFCRQSFSSSGLPSRPAHVSVASQSVTASSQVGLALQGKSPVTVVRPQRLASINVTRCHQISKEMVQWLRMHVTDVKCEPAKGVWGEPLLP